MTSPEIDLEVLLANLPCCVYWTDKAGTIIGCNDQQAQGVGFASSHELIGAPLSAINTEHYPNYALTINQQVMTTGQPYHAQRSITQPDGSLAVRLHHKIPLKDKADEVIGVLGISFDVSAMKKATVPLVQKQVEEMANFSNPLFCSPGYLYWKDIKGYYLGCNHQWATDLGLASSQQILGKTDAELFPQAIAAQLAAADQQIIQQKAGDLVEETIVLPDQRCRTLLVKRRPLFNAENEVVGIVCSALDISERKKARVALEVAKAQAERANQLKTQFIRDVEHDIRTPLSGVWSVLDVWCQDETDPEKKEMLVEMCRSLWQLMSYCNNILDFSRIEHNSVPVKYVPISLAELANNIVEMQAITAREKGLILSLNYDSTLPSLLYGDQYRLNRMLTNLMGNSIKFTKKGQVTLKIKSAACQASDDAPIWVQFDMEDSGSGMTKEKLQQLRTSFENFDPNVSGLYLGSGLGLRVVNQFIHELSGNMTIQSELDSGSTFSLLLPFKPVEVGA